MAETAGKRDRSPNFPFIPLKAAIDRLMAFEKYFGRHPAPLGKTALAWGLKENSDQAGQITSALRYYGFLDYQGEPPARQAVLTDDGRTYLRAQQDSVKQEVIARAALKPRMIHKFWDQWGADRPPDPVCLDELILKNSFSDRGAIAFLKVYDATIAFAGLGDSDKSKSESEDDSRVDENTDHAAEMEYVSEQPSPPVQPRGALPFRGSGGGEVRVMEGERELTTGLLSKDAGFRLIVNGPVGVKEIERLIRKLELDKEILADESDETAEEE